MPPYTQDADKLVACVGVVVICLCWCVVGDIQCARYLRRRAIEVRADDV